MTPVLSIKTRSQKFCLDACAARSSPCSSPVWIAAVVFGSAARGTLNATSDIDLLVVGDGELSEVLEALKPAEQELHREINPVVYLPGECRQRLKDKRHFPKTIAAGPKVTIMGNLDVA